jgi:hypothetical protein
MQQTNNTRLVNKEKYTPAQIRLHNKQARESVKQGTTTYHTQANQISIQKATNKNDQSKLGFTSKSARVRQGQREGPAPRPLLRPPLSFFANKRSNRKPTDLFLSIS